MTPGDHNGCCPTCRNHHEECHLYMKGMGDKMDKIDKVLGDHIKTEDTDLGIVIGKVDVILKMGYILCGTFGIGLVLALVKFVLDRIP